MECCRRPWHCLKRLCEGLVAIPPTLQGRRTFDLLRREVFAFGLRTVKGWQLRDFRDRTGFSAMDLRGPQLRRLAQDGLLSIDAETVRPTRKGLLFNDTVIAELL